MSVITAYLARESELNASVAQAGLDYQSAKSCMGIDKFFSAWRESVVASIEHRNTMPRELRGAMLAQRGQRAC